MDGFCTTSKTEKNIDTVLIKIIYNWSQQGFSIHGFNTFG